MIQTAKRYTPIVFSIGVILGFASFFFSPFLISISTALLGISILPYCGQIWKENKYLVLSSLFLILLALSDYLRPGITQVTHDKLLLTLGFFVAFTASLHHFRNHPKTRQVLLALAIIVACVNIYSVANYFLNRAEIDFLLSEGKSIPIPNTHHIHFGIINALMLVLLWFSSYRKSDNKVIRVSVYVLLVLIAVCFHILSSRTGLIALYGAIITGGLVFGFINKKFKPVLAGVLLIISSIGLAYMVSSSFRAKISNSIVDIRSWGRGGEINFKSMGMRFEASKMCLNLISDNPLFGVGSAKMESAISQEYVDSKTVLLPVNRIGPHNQWLEYGVKYGIVGILLLCFLFYSMARKIEVSNLGMWIVFFVVVISMLFESLLERQVSIFFIAILVGYGLNLMETSESSISESQVKV